MRRNTVAINNVLKKKTKKKEKREKLGKNAKKKKKRNALWITIVIHSILCTGEQ